MTYIQTALFMNTEYIYIQIQYDISIGKVYNLIMNVKHSKVAA